MICFGIFIRFSILSYQEYNQYGVVTVTNKYVEKRKIFPAVTFCFWLPGGEITLEETFIGASYEYNIFSITVNDFKKIELTLIEHVNCYTLNSGVNSSGHSVDLFQTTAFGLGSGLNINFYIPTKCVLFCHIGYNTVVPSKNEFIHALNTKPLVQVLKVNKIINNKLGTPYNDCQNDLITEKDFDSELYRKIIRSKIKYRQINCYDECTKEFSNQTFDFDAECHPKCPRECDAITYDIVPIDIKFPVDLSKTVLKYQEKLNNYNITEKDVLSNSINVMIIEDEWVLKITEHPKITSVNLFSNIGGLAGLFLGVSFLSIYPFMIRLLKNMK